MAVRRYYDYTRDELYALTPEQVQGLIEIEIAFNGIIPCTEPIKPPDKPNPIAKTVEAFEVRGVYYLSKDDALTAAALQGYIINYDYKIGYEYKFLDPSEATVNCLKFYKRGDVMEHAKTLQAQQKLTTQYDNDIKEYKKYAEQTKSVVQSVTDTIDTVHDYFHRRDKVISEFNRLYTITQDAAASLKLVKHTYIASEQENDDFFVDAMKIIHEDNHMLEVTCDAE